MMNSPSKEQKIFVTVISIAIGIGLKRLMKHFWVKQYNEEPPDLKATEKLDWGKIIIWSTFTGLFLRLIKIGVKRSLSIALKKNKLLT